MLAAFTASASPALAQETTYSLTVRNGKFEPSTLAVKAGVKFKLVVSNKGTTPAEFESSELNREKVVPAGASMPLYIGPLAPGAYPFFDDFDQKNRGHVHGINRIIPRQMVTITGIIVIMIVTMVIAANVLMPNFDKRYIAETEKQDQGIDHRSQPDY